MPEATDRFDRFRCYAMAVASVAQSVQSNNLKQVVADPEALCTTAPYQPASLLQPGNCNLNFAVIIGRLPRTMPRQLTAGHSNGAQKKHRLMRCPRQAKHPSQFPRLQDREVHQSHGDARKAFLTARTQGSNLYLGVTHELLCRPVRSTPQ